MTEDPKTTWKTFTEEIEVTGHQLVEHVTRLLAEGNVRQLQLRSERGDVYVAVPLAAGAIVGGVVVLAAPWLAIIGAIAGLAAKVTIGVVRATPPSADETAQDTGEPPLGDN
ncbi:DUF4342 domain-containing protein [Devosia sp. SL43]|uniref:DUF4342 domain-containing protein n=1 Tax=Devosia sp. SL43 TaxID=2806348 RepID=UPI001F475381|nr:DUF4342 domain-containing protein [Devosia sp. SL43]